MQRAQHHLAELQESIQSALDECEQHFSVEIDSETGQQVFRAHNLPAINPEWSLTVGDVLHNLRSSLDYLAWQLVTLDGGEPGNQTQFPIRATPFSKRGNLTATQLTPPVRSARILAALEACQPYRGPGGEPVAVDRSPLWLLHQLNIIDKHRLLLVVVCVLNSDEMWWSGDAAMPAPKIKISTGPLEEGSPVAWFDWQGADPPVDFDPHPTLAVSMAEKVIAGKLGDRLTPIRLVEVLQALCYAVEWEVVMLHFEPLFAEME